jgi:hypothetical protein
MTHISSLLSSDSRDLFEKMRRLECERLCEAWEIPYPANAPKDDIVAILKGNGVDPLKAPPKGEGVKFVEVQVQTEDGRTVTHLYPEQKKHYTADKDIDYEAVLEQRAKENQAASDQKDQEIAELKAMVMQLMGKTEPDPEAPEMKSVNYEDMDIEALREIAESKGIKVHHRAGKSKIIEALMA